MAQRKKTEFCRSWSGRKYSRFRRSAGSQDTGKYSAYQKRPWNGGEVYAV